MFATILISVVLLGLAALAVRHLYKQKKTGGCSGCAGCNQSCSRAGNPKS